MINSLSSKVTFLNVIMLTVTLNPFITNSSYIIHFPILSDAEIRTILLSDTSSKETELTPIVVHHILLFYSSQTNSLSELRALRDMVLAYCSDHHYTCSNEKEIQSYIASLQDSLFVNIMPVFSEHMESLSDTKNAIPLSDYCGLDISFNAKLLLIAGYLCSVYPESEDQHLFGRDAEQHVKTKGRRRRKVKPIGPSLVEDRIRSHI